MGNIWFLGVYIPSLRIHFPGSHELGLGQHPTTQMQSDEDQNQVEVGF